MNDHRRVLRRVGFVLIAIGVADIGFMIYCIATERSYSSSVNVFAVAAGVFLIRGSLRAVRIVTCISAFLLSALGGALLVVPFVQPMDLWLTELRLDPVAFAMNSLFAILFLILVAWVYWRLRSPEVLRAR